jgi:hypothetical protein
MIIKLLRLNINKSGYFVQFYLYLNRYYYYNISIVSTWDLRIMIGTISYENSQNKYFIIANIAIKNGKIKK